MEITFVTRNLISFNTNYHGNYSGPFIWSAFSLKIIKKLNQKIIRTMLRVTLKRSNINGEKLGAAFLYNFLNKFSCCADENGLKGQ